MPTATVIAVAGLALSAAGTGAAVIQQRKSGRAAKDAANEQKKAAALEAAKVRRRNIRQARIARGAALNQASAVGAGDSSGSSGGLSGIGSQFGANAGFFEQGVGIQKNISSAITKSNVAAGRASLFGGIADLGASIFGNSKKIGRLIDGTEG